MKIKINHFIYILFALYTSNVLYAQDFSLLLSSKNKTDLVILSEIKFNKNHKDSVSIIDETKKISSYLKNIGYFTNTFDSIQENNKIFTAYYTLNRKIEKAIIKTYSKFLLNDLSKEKNIISVPIKELQPILSIITQKLDKEGKSFSKAQLKNISIKENILYADLEIKQSEQRKINKVIVKGYEDFPKSYLKNHLYINPNTIFNQEKLIKISSNSKSIRFAKEIKKPEVLFTKDSTLIYIYLKKHQISSFDGIINFASQKDGGILFNGNIDLKLNNILNTGENFELFWNSITEERQEFRLSAEIPYLFNSKFSPQLSFSIYKQDSTFLNTRFNSKLLYRFNTKTKLGITYLAESSENLEEAINNNIETFSNYFIGFQFKYNIPKNDAFFNDKFNLEINPSIGNRKTTLKNSNQFKIEASSSFLWNFSLRNSLFIKNTTGYLNSDSFLDNELFRIGGANSIRGFNEQSIFTDSYTYFNIEYRYLTSEKSYLYNITDIGRFKNQLSTENLLGIGIGYLFKTNRSQINIATVLGKNTSQDFDFNNSKIIINWKSFF